MRATALECVGELAEKDDRVFFIGSDLGQGSAQAFRDAHPDRFFMEGIAEANLIGMAAGFAFEGKIPYVNTIATFLTRRCLEQVAVDLCLHNLSVRLIANGGGMVYAPLGPTHLAVEDIALMRALPNMTIIAPADADEMRRLMPLTVEYDGPIYIRLAKGYDPIVTSDAVPFAIGKALPVRDGEDALVLTTGVTLGPALEAAERLDSGGVSTGVLHVPTVKPLDEQTILEAASSVRAVVTIEEHTIYGGLGSAVAEIMAESRLTGSVRFQRIGLPDVFPDQYGSQASLMERYKITTDHLVSVVKDSVEVQSITVA
ncbi:MAG: transketolase [Gemmatimonadetes bacterium]|mgnify:CR=1 FL=1|nr:transketolase [Gemmatimonadota bacterium]|tara:strand:+ start:286 stop:1230 length:945 start_codon:yes stop_codon:yes gene_type:complete